MAWSIARWITIGIASETKVKASAQASPIDAQPPLLAPEREEVPERRAERQVRGSQGVARVVGAFGHEVKGVRRGGRSSRARLAVAPDEAGSSWAHALRCLRHGAGGPVRMAPGSDGLAPARGARMCVWRRRCPFSLSAGKGRTDPSSLAAVWPSGQGSRRNLHVGAIRGRLVRVLDERLVDRGDALDGRPDVAGIDVAALGRRSWRCGGPRGSRPGPRAPRPRWPRVSSMAWPSAAQHLGHDVDECGQGLGGPVRELLLKGLPLARPRRAGRGRGPPGSESRSWRDPSHGHSRLALAGGQPLEGRQDGRLLGPEAVLRRSRARERARCSQYPVRLPSA